MTHPQTTVNQLIDTVKNLVAIGGDNEFADTYKREVIYAAEALLQTLEETPLYVNDPDKDKYNGWTNHATWVVNLWMESSVEDLVSDPDEYNTDHALTCAVADALKDEVEEFSPLADDATMYSDLLTGYLCDVNWYEIAEHYVADYRYENPREGTKGNPCNFVIESDIPDSKEVYWPMYAQTDTSDTFNLFERIGSDNGGFMGSFWAAFNRCVEHAVEHEMTSIVIAWDFSESDVERYTSWKIDQTLKAQQSRNTKA